MKAIMKTKTLIPRRKRLEAYNELYYRLLNNKCKSMCEFLNEFAVSNIKDKSYTYYGTEFFPEIESQRPKNLKVNAYWFPFGDNGQKRRMNVVIRAIYDITNTIKKDKLRYKKLKQNNYEV